MSAGHPLDLVARLQAAESEEERVWLVTETLLHTLPAALQQATWAAALPHWFDGPILAALLELSLEQAGGLYQALQGLPFVEPFQARGGHNVHEVTRTALLRRLWSERRDHFLALSARAAAFFGAAAEPEWQIEAVYHLLVSDPEQGVKRLRNLDADWTNSYQLSLEYALGRTAAEQADAGRLEGRARGWAYYCLGDAEWRYYHHHEARHALERALESTGDDRQLEAGCLQSLGNVHFMQSEFAAARDRYEGARDLYTALGDRLGQANCLKSLGDVDYMSSEFAAARDRYEQAHALYIAIDNRPGEADCLQSLGNVDRMLSDAAAARDRYEQARDLYAALGNRLGEANCLKSLGDIDYMLDEYAAARGRYEAARTLYVAVGNQQGEANCLQALGDVDNMLDEYAAARGRYEQARALYAAVGDRLGQANCGAGLGDVARAGQDWQQAAQLYRAALDIYRALGMPLNTGLALRRLGGLAEDQGDRQAASQLYAEALAMFEAIGVDAADGVRADLERLREGD